MNLNQSRSDERETECNRWYKLIFITIYSGKNILSVNFDIHRKDCNPDRGRNKIPEKIYINGPF